MSHFDPAAMLSFDLETTSVDTSQARIVTSAMVRIDASGAHPREILADPGVEIPADAQRIHGISTEYAREHGRPHEDVLAETVDEIHSAWQEGLSLIVYNANYDLSVLRALTGDFQVTGTVYDPFVIDKLKDRYRKGRRTLTDLSKHYQVRLDNAHEATADALAAARIAWKQVRLWPELTQMSVAELMEFQAVGYYEMQTEFRSFLESQGRDPSTVSTSWPMQG